MSVQIQAYGLDVNIPNGETFNVDTKNAFFSVYVAIVKTFGENHHKPEFVSG